MTDTPGTAATPSLPLRQWVLLAVVCTALLLEGMSLSSTNIQIPSIQRDLGLSESALPLVVSAFLVAFAGFLLLGGQCADVFGRRRVFITGLVLFAGASALAGMAEGAAVLVTARALQGLGAALSLPAAVSIITNTFEEGRPRNQALAVYSATGAAGFGVGLLVAGASTELFDWRWGFWVYVPFALTAVVGAVLTVPAHRPESRSTASWGSYLLISWTLIAVVAAAALAQEQAWMLSLLVVVAALVPAVWFITIQRGSPTPPLPRDVVAAVPVLVATASLALGFGTVTSALFLAGVGLQEELGYGALMAGVALLPQGIMVLLLSSVGATLTARIGPHRTLVTGLAFLGAGTLLLLTMNPAWSYWFTVLPASTLIGIGVAFIFPASNIMAVNAVALERHGVTASLIATGQQAGGAIGLAFVGAVLYGAQSFNADAATTWALAASAAYCVLGVLLVWYFQVKERRNHGKKETSYDTRNRTR